MDQPVDKNQTFPRFLSTFGSERAEFGVSGRQKRVIYLDFCLLSGPCTTILDQPVDKIHTFPRFLSTFGSARPVFDESGSQKSDFPLCSLRFLIILPSALDFSRKGFFKAPLAAFRPGSFRMTNTASKA